MLFKNVAEIKEHLPISNSFEIEDIRPFLDAVEEDDIIPLLSQQQYDHFEAAYLKNELSADQKALQKKLRRALANMAYYNYIPFGNVTFGKGKISVSKGEGEEIASQWRIEDIKEACENNFYKASEQMLLFLEAKKAVFTLWAASDSFTIFKECFINTAVEFSQFFEIAGSRRTFLLMKSLMKQVEKDQIKSITGEALYDQLKTQIRGSTVSPNNSKLLDFIKPCVANFTGAAATLRLPVKWTKQGIQVLSTSYTQTQNVQTTAAEEHLKPIRDAANQEAEKQKKNLSVFLYKNHADYPLFEADSSVYIAVKTLVDDSERSTGALW